MAKRSSDFIDFKSLFRQYKSHWYYFLISVIVCGALGFVYIKRTPEKFAVKANVLIAQENDNMAEALGSMSELFGSSGNVDDEIFIISSHTVYRDVAKALRLNIKHMVRKAPTIYEFAYPEYPVDVIPAPGLVDTLSNTVTFKISVNEDMLADISMLVRGDKIMKVKKQELPCTLNSPYGNFTIAATPDYPQGESVRTNVYVSSYDGAAEELNTDVHSEIASKRSNVISLSIETPNPDFGKAVLNQIIAKYNEHGIAEKNVQSELTAAFLEERLAILAADLSSTEQNIQDYKEGHGIVDVGHETAYQTQKRAHLEAALLEAQTQAEILSIAAQFLNDPANNYSMMPVNVDNEGVQQAIKDYNAMIARRAEMLQAGSEQNPALIRYQTRIDLTRQSLKETLAGAYNAALIAVNDVQNEMNSASSRLDNVPQQERETANLRRQQTLKSQIYFFLLRRAEENAMMLANATPKGEVVDEAYTLTEPLGMGRKAIMLIALFVGMCIPPVYLYTRKLLYNRFESRSDVERVTDVPILGEMCIDRSGKRLVVGSDVTDSTAELFRLMRSNLMFILNNPREQVVLLTSTSSGEGKSYISINLAASLALLKKKVLIIGMDIRNPQIANYLDINPRFGLTQYLSSENIELPDIITHLPEVPGLDVICAGPVPPNPAELLLSAKVDRMFVELRNKYDFIVVDTAPIGLVSDTFTLDRISDATVYVCRANHTSLNDLSLINEIYEQQRLKKLSLVINGTIAKKNYGYRAKN